jgi:hypothetical protein
VCHHVVGTEETVQTRRMFNTIMDNMYHDEVYNQIISGSSGEGLEMKGSDLDIMLVFKDVNVYENVNTARLNSAETCVAMEMDDSKIGFSHLRLFTAIMRVFQKCAQILEMICICLISYVNQIP